MDRISFQIGTQAAHGQRRQAAGGDLAPVMLRGDGQSAISRGRRCSALEGQYDERHLFIAFLP